MQHSDHPLTKGGQAILENQKVILRAGRLPPPLRRTPGPENQKILLTGQTAPFGKSHHKQGGREGRSRPWRRGGLWGGLLLAIFFLVRKATRYAPGARFLWGGLLLAIFFLGPSSLQAALFPWPPAELLLVVAEANGPPARDGEHPHPQQGDQLFLAAAETDQPPTASTTRGLQRIHRRPRKSSRPHRRSGRQRPRLRQRRGLPRRGRARGRKGPSRPTGGRLTLSRKGRPRPTKSRPTKSRPTKRRPTKRRPTKSRPRKRRPTKSRPTKSRPTKSRPRKRRRKRRRRYRKRSLRHTLACRRILKRRFALRYVRPRRRLEYALTRYIKKLRYCGILQPFDKTRILVYDYRNCKLVAINQNMRTSAASLIKPFVMLAVYYQARKRGIAARRFPRRLQRHINRMIQVSNNASTNYLIRHLGRGSARRGLRYINRLLPLYGIRQTKLVELIPRSGRTYRNYTTARNLSILLYRIYKKTAVSRAYSRRMMRVLLRSHDNRGKTHYLRTRYGVSAATKTGYTRRTNGVAGIVVRGARLDQHPYNFVAIVTRPLVRGANEWLWKHYSTQILQRLSEMTYRHYALNLADGEVRRFKRNPAHAPYCKR